MRGERVKGLLYGDKRRVVARIGVLECAGEGDEAFGEACGQQRTAQQRFRELRVPGGDRLRAPDDTEDTLTVLARAFAAAGRGLDPAQNGALSGGGVAAQYLQTRRAGSEQAADDEQCVSSRVRVAERGAQQSERD